MSLFIIHQGGVEHLRQIGAVQSVIVEAADESGAVAAAMALNGAHLQITDDWSVDALATVASVPLQIEGHPVRAGSPDVTGFKSPRGA